MCFKWKLSLDPSIMANNLESEEYGSGFYDTTIFILYRTCTKTKYAAFPVVDHFASCTYGGHICPEM